MTGDLSELRAILARNLRAVEERIAAACRRAQRPRSEVTLVAITKYVDCAVAGLLLELGVRELGESRPQELWRKAEALPKSVNWHLVGHLQRNKIERTLPLVVAIHSVDSIRLLEAIAAEVKKRQPAPAPTILLEVNMSGEAAKHGFSPAELPPLVAKLKAIEGIRIAGLMTMAALSEAPEAARPAFRGLRLLRDQLRALWPEPNVLPHLSMGMTHDFEVAVEEGATMVRIGSALFDGLPEMPR